MLGGEKLKKDKVSVHVAGFVCNNSDNPMNNHIQIEFHTYSVAATTQKTCLANTSSVDAHDKWKVDAICATDPSEVTTVKFKDLTGI